jgi:hypothetical protein
MKRKSISSRIFLVAFLALGLVKISAYAAVTMQLDQNQIHQDETAQLTVNVSGGTADEVSPPVVPGLEFTAVDQSSQVEVINGAVTANSTVTYEISAQNPGTYVIPVQGGSGKNLTLQVLAGNGPNPGKSASNSPSVVSTLPPPATSTSTPGDPDTVADGAAFIRMDLPKRPLYVGETVPVKIQIGLRAGIQPTLNGLPSLTADAFTLNKLSDKPEQSQEDINGRPYVVLTWQSALAAIKPGDFPLSITAPVTIEERAAVPQDGDDDSVFGGSFFQNILGAVTKKDLTLTNTAEMIHVLPLPAQGQPADFSGAVGNFTIASTVTPASAAAGDPLTLKLQIKGSGSFDRVDTSMLAATSDWKTYPPTSKFMPADSVGYSGEKDFEQAVIPLHFGQQRPPGLSFSFFDPESRRYETLRSEPPVVNIAPSRGPLAQNPVATSATTPATPTSSPRDGLLPDEVETGSRLNTLQPLFFQPGFIIGQSMLALGFLAVGLWTRRSDRLAADPVQMRRRQDSKTVEKYLNTMDAAAIQHDAPTFFVAARQALRHCLGPRWNIAPAAVTVAEIETHLNGKGENARRVFELADQLTYSSGEAIEADFGAWKDTVHQLVEQAEKL